MMPRVVVPIIIRIVDPQTKGFSRCRHQWGARGVAARGGGGCKKNTAGASFSSSSSVLQEVESKPHNNNNKNKDYYYYYIAAAAAAATGSLAVASLYTRNWREAKIAQELPLLQVSLVTKKNNQHSADELQIADPRHDSNEKFDCCDSSSTVRLGRDLTELRHVVQRAGLMGQMHKSVKAELEDIRKWHVSYSLSCYCTALQTTS